MRNRYRNTPEAALFLVPGSPADLSGAIRYNRDVHAARGRLKEMALSGNPVEKPEFHLGGDPERTRTFVMAMHGRALGTGRAVVPLLSPAGRRRVLDVVAVLFFGALHQEDPDAIRGLLRRTHEALAPGGLVYVLDMMTDASRTCPKFSALFSVNMALTSENGWVFSDEDLRGWLTEAGFRDVSVRPVGPPLPHWLASARK